MALCVGDSRPWRPRTEWRLERPVRCRGEIGGSECACVSRPAVEAQDRVVSIIHYIPPHRGRLLLWSRLWSVPGVCAHGPVGAECDRGQS